MITVGRRRDMPRHGHAAVALRSFFSHSHHQSLAAAWALLARLFSEGLNVYCTTLTATIDLLAWISHIQRGQSSLQLSFGRLHHVWKAFNLCNEWLALITAAGFDEARGFVSCYIRHRTRTCCRTQTTNKECVLAHRCDVIVSLAK